ncbi:hypothetical protein [Sinanaerobacter chloroacetimidivorans]|uniref:Uncharacterized protein n=1 Tax=Sinanaerobacter chloroacetimidivorans TaxID=2818044 RepID=A0A8J7W2M3_9FIRM|nr:hypothetical protein [Sinanaerobacter chloroacetimidivorans]MBR0599241.1 hypothetical protein [Sinanaerobacter chloroacetimidivorans]
MNYVKYNRALVMMEEQGNQFASKESTPIKGYLKIETGNNKGALRCAVQNLKYYDKGEYIYKLILFGKKGERTIHTIIGNLLINRQGTGETYFRFQPLDLDGKGTPFHNFSTAIIAAASTTDEKEPLHPVLKGITFSENDPFQSELFEVGTDADEEEEQLARDMDLSEEEEEKEEYGAEAAGSSDRTVSKKVYNSFYNEYVLNACAHTCRMAEYYEDVDPFEKDKTGARWKKIVNITNLPLVSPGAHYFATQYRHYIFGAKADQNGMAMKYYFGIPGRFLDEEQPDGGKSGFTYWQPIRGTDDTDGIGEKLARKTAYGYWIVAIDVKTGNIEEI